MEIAKFGIPKKVHHAKTSKRPVKRRFPGTQKPVYQNQCFSSRHKKGYTVCCVHMRDSYPTQKQLLQLQVLAKFGETSISDVLDMMINAALEGIPVDQSKESKVAQTNSN